MEVYGWGKICVDSNLKCFIAASSIEGSGDLEIIIDLYY